MIAVVLISLAVIRVGPLRTTIRSMRLYNVTIAMPAGMRAREAARVEKGAGSLLHALRPPPQSAGAGLDFPLVGKLVQLSQEPAWLRDQLLAVSRDLRMLVMPRDPAEACLVHPAALLPDLQIDRSDWDLTCVRFAQAAPKWQPPPSLWRKLTSWGKG